MTVAGARVSALICEGRVEQDTGLLEQAVVGLQTSGWLVELAGAQESLAIARVQEGNIAAARVAFEDALELYGDLDARRDVARVLGAMRAAGLRRGSRVAHRRTLKGWDALTAMESDVVRLCVDGLTNRQIGERLFISRRTVQTHLSHAFAKLDVTSRVELAAAAARRGETATGSPARPATTR
jgi:DNA-binding CsgD family transcriptional regulator